MADTVLREPEPEAFDNLMRAQGRALHARDVPPASRKDWEERRARLRRDMFAAMGPFPEQPCPLEPKVLGTLKRDGFRIERLLFQSRPDVWVTANAYVPEKAAGKLPAVLAVHGHWTLAKVDPVVQSRCLGLVKLGFFVLVIDAFGAGERHTEGPAHYHGALYGSTLWPPGLTLLGMQVYDNRRAVDYLRSRPEVDGDRLGVTGASGGGNQTMYAGALDERFRAVVPVCSVGSYQAYLHAACCVCEVLPGALRFAEEGDVLSLVAPRALMVVTATEDAYQFSPCPAHTSLGRARRVFQLFGVEDKLRHALFESGHAYNREMREAMYGWMTRWLKNEGSGTPIPEPKFEVEKPEDLYCFPKGMAPKGYVFLPAYAARQARALVAKLNEQPTHVEQWESTAVYLRDQLRKQVFGGFPAPPKPTAPLGKVETAGQVHTTRAVLYPEPHMPVPVLWKYKDAPRGKQPACVLLHLDGKAEALKDPLAGALMDKGWVVVAPDLRATGETRPEGEAIGTARDHNSAEHALWVGRPLLGQWVFDVSCVLDRLAAQPGLDPQRLAVVGLGPAGIVALSAAAVLDHQVSAAAAVGCPVTYITEEAYGPEMRMGLLAPGILRYADVPHLAALAAPRRVLIAGGTTPQGEKLNDQKLKSAYAFAAGIYKLHKAEAKLTVSEKATAEEIAAAL